MIIYTHGIEAGLKLSAEKLPNIGWVVTGKRKGSNGFRVLAVAEHGKGFKSRDETRAAVKAVKGN